MCRSWRRRIRIYFLMEEPARGVRGQGWLRGNLDNKGARHLRNETVHQVLLEDENVGVSFLVAFRRMLEGQKVNVP